MYRRTASISLDTANELVDFRLEYRAKYIKDAGRKDLRIPNLFITYRRRRRKSNRP